LIGLYFIFSQPKTSENIKKVVIVNKSSPDDGAFDISLMKSSEFLLPSSG
jgi:hypothetical protein